VYKSTHKKVYRNLCLSFRVYYYTPKLFNPLINLKKKYQYKIKMMNSTNFANSKQRVIRMGPRGGFYVARADGEKKRNPVARFRRAADGSMVKLTKANLPNVPEAIRPARAAEAKAAPKPRGRKPMTDSAKASKMFADILAKGPRKPRGRKPMTDSAKASKMFAAILAKGPRKVRKNKGVARKPKVVKVTVVSPNGGPSSRTRMAMRRAAAQKQMLQNPFASFA
jgi:hypothetical protein